MEQKWLKKCIKIFRLLFKIYFCFYLASYYMLYRSIFPVSQQSSFNNKQESSIRIKYPADIQKIVSSDRLNYGNLYLSNIQAAQDTALLKDYHITSIVSVAEGYFPQHQKGLIRHHLYLPIKENTNEFYDQLDKGVQFIWEKLLISNVLIHCVAGFERSACFAIAYIMKNKRVNFQQAYTEVRRHRKMMNISPKMCEQLKKYQIDLENQGYRKSRYCHSVRVNTQNITNIQSPSYFQSSSNDERSILAELYSKKDQIIEEDSLSRKSVKSKFQNIEKQSKSNYNNRHQIKTVNPEVDKSKQSFYQEDDTSFLKEINKEEISQNRGQHKRRLSQFNYKNDNLNRSIYDIQKSYEREIQYHSRQFNKQMKKVEDKLQKSSKKY